MVSQSDIEALRLRIAALLGIPALVQRYLSGPMKHEWSQEEKSAALWFATASGSVQSVELLVDHGARTDVTADGSPISELLHRPQSHEAPSLVRRRQIPVHKQTPLFPAIWNQSRAMVHLLLRSDVAWNDPHRGPLHVAVEQGDVKIIRMLMEHGVSPDTINSQGQRPISRFWSEHGHH